MAIIDIYSNATLYGKYSLVGIKDILNEINFSHTCFICRADEARCLQLWIEKVMCSKRCKLNNNQYLLKVFLCQNCYLDLILVFFTTQEFGKIMSTQIIVPSGKKNKKNNDNHVQWINLQVYRYEFDMNTLMQSEDI